jgi:hypothetical protein
MAPELRRTLTRHAQARIQQRGIAQDLLAHLFAFGTERHDHHGAVIVCFDRAAHRRAARARAAPARDLDRLAGIYAVETRGVIATVGHRHRRLRVG